MRRAVLPILSVLGLGAATLACDTEERQQCERLATDAQQWLTKSQELLQALGQSKAGLFAALDPAVVARTEELQGLGDSIADRWEKASPRCKQRVHDATKALRDERPALAGWSPDRLVELRDQRRQEAERAEQARLEEERRLREEEEARQRLGKALSVHLDSIVPQRRSAYSVTLDFSLPVTFRNTSDEHIVAASGRLKCFSNLENLEGYFYTEQTDLEIDPGESRTVTLGTDEIRSRWLVGATCSRQVWEPEAILFRGSGVVRAPLPDAPFQP